METNQRIKELCKELDKAIEGASRISPKDMEDIIRRASKAEDIRAVCVAVRARN